VIARTQVTLSCVSFLFSSSSSSVDGYRASRRSRLTDRLSPIGTMQSVKRRNLQATWGRAEQTVLWTVRYPHSDRASSRGQSSDKHFRQEPQCVGRRAALGSRRQHQIDEGGEGHQERKTKIATNRETRLGAFQKPGWHSSGSGSNLGKKPLHMDGPRSASQCSCLKSRRIVWRPIRWEKPPKTKNNA
jgi:hypothetical protein